MDYYMDSIDEIFPYGINAMIKDYCYHQTYTHVLDELRELTAEATKETKALSSDGCARWLMTIYNLEHLYDTMNDSFIRKYLDVFYGYPQYTVQNMMLCCEPYYVRASIILHQIKDDRMKKRI